MEAECDCDFCTKGRIEGLGFSEAHDFMIRYFFEDENHDYTMTRIGLGGRLSLTGMDFSNLDGEEDYQLFYVMKDNFNREYPWLPSNLDLFATDFVIYREELDQTSII